MASTIKNTGMIERIIRAIIGIALLMFAWQYKGSFMLSIIATILGIGMLLVTITGFCFIWRLLRINTCTKKECMNQQEPPQASENK